MKLFLKITAGVVAGVVVVIVAFAVLLGSAANSVATDSEKAAATPAQVEKVHHGMTRGQVHRLLAPAKPNLESSSSTAGVGNMAIESFDVKDGGRLFGKSVTVTYDNGRVVDVTKTDLGA